MEKNIPTSPEDRPPEIQRPTPRPRSKSIVASDVFPSKREDPDENLRDGTVGKKSKVDAKSSRHGNEFPLNHSTDVKAEQNQNAQAEIEALINTKEGRSYLEQFISKKFKKRARDDIKVKKDVETNKSALKAVRHLFSKGSGKKDKHKGAKSGEDKEENEGDVGKAVEQDDDKESEDEHEGTAKQEELKTNGKPYIDPHLCNQLYSSMKEAVEEKLKAWLQKSWTRDYFPGLQKNFTQNFIQNIWRDKSAEFCTLTDTIDPVIAEDIMQDLQDYLDSFIDQLNNYVERFCQLTDSNVPCEIALEKILSSVKICSASLTECIQIGCRRISTLEKLEKKSKAEEQEALASQCLQHLPTFFLKEIAVTMERHQGLCPKVLDQMLKNLHDESAFICRSVLAVEEIVVKTESNLNVTLQQECERIQTKYLDVLQLQQAKVHRLVMHYKSQYEIQIDSFIKSSQFLENDFSEQAYNDHHNLLKKHVSATFVEDIASELGKDEPTDKHVETLVYHMEKGKRMFQRKVAVKVGATNLKGHVEQENRSPLPPAILPPPAEHIKRDELKIISGRKVLAPAEDAAPVSHNAPQEKYEAESILLVQLTQDKIGLAVTEYKEDKYSPRAVQEEFFVPFEVAVTDKNDWYYGLGVKSNDKTANHSLFQRQWKISSYFALPFSKPNESSGGSQDTFTADNSTYTITPEFLLATLLGLVRLELKDQQDIKIEKVYIAVPFWYTSYTREQVIDAAKIGGFDEQQVHIINENACLAFLIFQNDLSIQNGSPDNEFTAVVVSENSGIVDTSVFKFDNERHKMQILGYSGLYHMARTTEIQQDSFISRIVPEVRKFMYFGKSFEKEKDELSQRMHYAFDEAKQLTVEGRHIKQIMSFVSHNSLSVFEGMTHLYEYLMNNSSLSLESLLGSASPLEVFVVPPNGDCITVAARQKSGKQKYVFKCNLEGGKYQFYQMPETTKCRFQFGTLTIQREAEKRQAIDVTLEMSQNGVIVLEKVEVFNCTDNSMLDDTAYTWEPRTLKVKERLECEKLFNKIFHKKKFLGERDVEENSTQQFFQEMWQAFEKGQGLYPTTIGKTLVGKELETIQYLLAKNKRNSEMKDLCSVHQKLKHINDKYKLTSL